jgi:tetratricopeptide (TPR) repeat protein
MAPEQAGGQAREVSPAADVYALGAILYELLTGRPPFKAATPLETLLQVRGEDPVPPSRLQSRTPRDLETICLKCLAKAPGQRYRDAAALAEDLRRFQAGEAILARPVGWVQHLVKWVKRKPTAAALWGVLLAVALFGAGFGVWLVLARAEAAGEVDGRLGQAVLLCDQEKWGAAREVAKQAEALLGRGGGGEERRRRVRELLADLEMVERVEEIRLQQAELRDERFDLPGADSSYAAAFREYGLDVESLTPAEVAARIRKRPIQGKLVAALEDWAFVRRDGGIGDAAAWQRLLEIAQLADPDPTRSGLRDALRDQDVKALKAVAAEAGVADLPAATVWLLGDALARLGALPEAEKVLRQAHQQHPGDFWINHHLAFHLLAMRPPQVDEAIRFYTAALALRPRSPGVHLNLGDALRSKGRVEEAIAHFEEAIRLSKGYAMAHFSLGDALTQQGRLDEAIKAYQEAVRLKPDHPEAHCNLGIVLKRQGRLDEAIAAYREALRIKPDFPEAYKAHFNLGNALAQKGQLDEAIAAYRDGLRLMPGDAMAHFELGIALADKGQLDEAIKAYQEAVRLKPDFPGAHYSLGVVLKQQGRPDEAIKAYQEAIRLKPGYPEAHCNLGNALKDKGDVDGAIREYRLAIDCNPKHAYAHNNLGKALQDKGDVDGAIREYRLAIDGDPKYALAHNNLGNALREKGDVDGAIREFRVALDLDPKYAMAHYNLGAALASQGKRDEAIKPYREAIRLNKDYALAHYALGLALSQTGRADQAILACQEAIRLNKDYAEAHAALGFAFVDKGEFDRAIVSFREAIRLKPDYVFAHLGLAYPLKYKGQFTEALAAFRRGDELGSRDPHWNLPSKTWVRECERLIELDGKLPAFLGGDARPANAAERIEFAQVCRFRGLPGVSARLYGEAFTEQPELAEDLKAAHRDDAACAAALAGCGRGKDAAKVDATERARWRKQALEWLRADLTLWAKLLDSDTPQARAGVQQKLRHWQRDPDLAGLRDPAALAELPEAEREGWRQLWADVGALLKRASPE